MRLAVLLCAALLALTSCTHSPDEIRFSADERLFAVFACLNACGFDDEYSETGMSPTRLALREDLKRLEPRVLEDIRTYYAAHESLTWYDYTVYAFMLSGPPAFEMRSELKQSRRAIKMDDFRLLLRRFYAQAHIADLWANYKPDYTSDIERHRDELAGEVADMWDYLRIEPSGRPASRITVVPNLLNSYFRATQYEDEPKGDLYMIPGPYSPNAPISATVIHETLHSITRPLMQEHIDLVSDLEPLMDLVKARPTIKFNYGGRWPNVVDESLVRALTWRIVFARRVPQAYLRSGIEREYAEGFVLIWRFYEDLEGFENSEVSFTEYYPELLRSVDLETERNRWNRGDQASSQE